MAGYFITFEGTEGSGKSTQLKRLEGGLQSLNRPFRFLREPGGTPIGEEIRHTLQHSHSNAAMTPEAELLLVNASRAQLTREVIRPALQAGEIVVCDRFYDSTMAYQGYGRELDLQWVRRVIEFAVGSTRPDLTLLLHVPLSVSEERREQRTNTARLRDRMEEAGKAFFQRVEAGYLSIAAGEPKRVKVIDATQSIDMVAAEVWKYVASALRLGQSAPE
jgi:dTMP kinase